MRRKKGREKSTLMKTKIATVPRLVETTGDWYVYFSVLHPLTGKMVPQKIYKGFKNCQTRREKIAWGDKLVREYTEKLKRGWNPIDADDTVIYNDSLEYSEMAKRFEASRKTVRNCRYYLSEFLAAREQELKIKTYQTYKSKLRIFANWLDNKGFGSYDVSAIDEAVMRGFFSFLNDQGLDKLTVLKYKQILTNYWKHLIRLKKVVVNPVSAMVAPPKRKDEAARPINEMDLKKLLETIKETDPQLYLVCMFEYYSALRPGQEIRLLRINDLDIYNNVITVTDANAKTVRRSVDMPRQLAALIADYRLGAYNREFYVFGKYDKPGPVPVGVNTFRNRFNAFRDKLGLPKTYKLYSLKHTGMGRLLEAGLTLEEIRDHAGHRSIESTEHYIKRHFGNRNRRVIDSFPDV